jgi:hypothetical protein
MRPSSTREVVEARFWAKVEKADGCWAWIGNKPNGYGRMKIAAQVRPATHVVWWLTKGEWPASGMLLCHHCDNPKCVNPSHLFMGTPADNSRDREAKGRGKQVDPRSLRRVRGSEHGHSKLTEDQAREVIGLLGRVPQRDIADRYGVTQGLISLIASGRIWTHLPRPTDMDTQRLRARGSRNGRAKLTEAQAREIRASREPTAALSVKYGVGETMVREIRAGTKWRHA